MTCSGRVYTAARLFGGSHLFDPCDVSGWLRSSRQFDDEVHGPGDPLRPKRSSLILDEPPGGGERQSMLVARSGKRIEHITGRQERFCTWEANNDGWSAARLPDRQIDARIAQFRSRGENDVQNRTLNLLGVRHDEQRSRRCL